MEGSIGFLLNGHLYSDAIRLAGIYHAEVNNEDSLYLVALSYFRSKKVNACYQILSRTNCTQPKCRLLLGQCCFELAKYHEAERAFLGEDIPLESLHNNNDNINNNNQQPTASGLKEQLVRFYGNEAAAIAAKYLGSIFERTSRAKEAVEFFRISVELFPYIWSSAEALTRLSDKTTSSSTTNSNFSSISRSNFLATALSKFKAPTSIHLSSVSICGNGAGGAAGCNNGVTAGSIGTPQSQLATSTDFYNNATNITITVASATTINQTHPQHPHAPLQLEQHHSTANTNYLNNHNHQLQQNQQLQQQQVVHQSQSLLDKSTPSNNHHVSEYKAARRAPPPVRKGPRRSDRLYSIENNNGQTPATTLRQAPAISSLAVMGAPAKKVRRLDPEFSLDSIGKIFLETFKGIDLLNHYDLEKSISILNGLPERHRESGWVLSCIARAHYEKTNYDKSVKYYEAARRLEPYRLEGMEYYSTALWHLHKEVDLSRLAKELMDFDQEAPETWCVAGNCYSLQKEHEQAIKFLEKAIKVDPNFAYAYTLLGHELISAERLDQAMTHFRNAVRLDPRHWNAWAGLGCIYYKNELYSQAELYYKKALKIAPTNPVLMCQVAVVQHACKRSQAAIETLTKALEIDSDNALCRFHRANTYSAIDKNVEALEELDALKRLVPKESMVYFLIGKIHKKMGDTHTALMNFSWAMELDPKGANNTIRDVIDKQHSNEDDVVVHRDQCVDACS